MSEEKISIFETILHIFKSNIKNIPDERRKRSDIKYLNFRTTFLLKKYSSKSKHYNLFKISHLLTLK